MIVCEVDEAGRGENLILRERPEPKPDAGQVIIKVFACGLNLVDLVMMSGRYQKATDYPFIPGQEVSGTVTDVGAGVANFQAGDRVIARCSNGGGLAAYVATNAADCVRLPDSVCALAAAVFPISFGTADHFLRRLGNISRGKRVLVLGAAGAVGSAALQLCQEAEAMGLAIVSSVAKRDFVLANGAADCLVVDPAKADAGPGELSKLLKSFLGSNQPDIVLDPLGGSFSEAALRNVAVGGHHLVVGFAAGIPRIPLNLPLLRRCQIAGDSFRAFCEQQPATAYAGFEDLVTRVAAGTLQPSAPAHLFDLDQVREAFRVLADRATIGRIAVRLNPSAIVPQEE